VCQLTPFESRFCNKAEAPGPLTLGYLALNSASCARSISFSFCNDTASLLGLERY